MFTFFPFNLTIFIFNLTIFPLILTIFPINFTFFFNNLMIFGFSLQFDDFFPFNLTIFLCNISGHLKLTEYGPRIYWKKHHLSDMPLGYGGCYAIQKLSNNVKMRFRLIFSFPLFFLFSDNACSYLWWKANRC